MGKIVHVYVTVPRHKCVSVQETEPGTLHTIDPMSTLELLSTSSVCVLFLLGLAGL